MKEALPRLTIAYSSDFSISIEFSDVQNYEVASPDYRFRFACRIRHPTGEFTYKADDIFFSPQVFREFAKQLDAIKQGKLASAGFQDYGHMIEFSISVRDRKPHAALRIREQQAGTELTTLSASFLVDFDLFVNALGDKAAQFSAELATVIPGAGGSGTAR